MTDRPPGWDAPVVVPPIDTTFDRIMVPFDGSTSAELALGYAVALADRTGGEILVAVAYDPPVTMRRRASLTVGDTRSEMARDAVELAEEAVVAVKANGHQARGIVVEGDIVDAILETATTESVDIIIIGRRGLTAEVRESRPVVGAFRQFVQGSVADKVSRHAGVPVLLVG